MKTLEDLVRELPPELREEVRQYAERLIEARRPGRSRRLRLDWAGGLREFRDQYTALRLQDETLDRWGH